MKLRGRPALSFEDWNVNDVYVTRNQTISNTDVVRFVQMTGYAGESLFNDKTYWNRVGRTFFKIQIQIFVSLHTKTQNQIQNVSFRRP